MQTKIKMPFIHRTGEPKEISLKNFYLLTPQQKEEHINELANLEFDQLSETDKGVVYFYFQNWLLEDWPGNTTKSNFISIFDILPQQEGESVTSTLQNQSGEIVGESNSSMVEQLVEPVVIDNIPTVDEVCELGVKHIKKYLSVYFGEEYSDWEPVLKFASSVDTFIDATSTFMYLDDLCKVHLRAYMKKMKK